MNAFADLDAPVPPQLEDELLKRIPYVSEGISNARLDEARRRVTFELPDEFAQRVPDILAAIVDVAQRLSANQRAVTARTLARRPDLPSAFCDDPHPLLEARGDIVPLGRGRYAFGPRLVALMKALDARITDIAGRLAAPAYAFPALIGAEILDRCQYFRNFPSSLSFVSHLREDHASIRDFAREARWQDGQLAFDATRTSPVDCLLAPSVCFHWYACIAGRTLEPQTITAVGRCFRYESTNLTGLQRLWDFTMREVIFLGPPEYVAARRQVCIDETLQLLDGLGLAYEVTTATDPFFADVYAAQAAYQQGFELKFELLAPLPYSGRRLAVGSINYHQDFFGRAFDIHSGDVRAHTGCLAFGLERLALAFIAQHGMDEHAWRAWIDVR